MNDQNTKYSLLQNVTNNPSVLNEIFDYTQNKFKVEVAIRHKDSFPLPNEDYVNTWCHYQEMAKKSGLFETLKSCLVQFQFPIKKNISQSYEYRAATLKGKSTDEMITATGLNLNDKDALELQIYQSVAGKIPVLTVNNDEDFRDIVRALTHRNEPIPIPKSMGAAMVKGINNWNRIETLKNKWLARNPLGNWRKEFVENILPNKFLYQDRIIILSRKPYSGVPSHYFGNSLEEWTKYSIQIRLEHECAHFFTLRHYGHMANNMHDELVADYMGISKVLGKFNADWFLKFVGLEDYPKYRSGARLENYLGNPPVSKEGFNLLKTIVKRAAHNVAEYDEYLGPHQSTTDSTMRLMGLCSLDLLQISSEQGAEKLVSFYKNNARILSSNTPSYEE